MIIEEEKDTSSKGKEDLFQRLNLKKQYINDFIDAVDEGDDLKIYQMLNPFRYKNEINSSFNNLYDEEICDILNDQKENIAHCLSDNLINFLVKEFPFFYYKEANVGQLEVFFGKWQGYRKFGVLDILNIEFILDEKVTHKLEKTIELFDDDKTYYTDQIQDLVRDNERLKNKQSAAKEIEKIDEQIMMLTEQLDQISGHSGLFGGSKDNEERHRIVDQIKDLNQKKEDLSYSENDQYLIKYNDEEILELSKEDVVLGYEKLHLLKAFKSFSDFKNKSDSLYHDYLTNLLEENSKDVKDGADFED